MNYEQACIPVQHRRGTWKDLDSDAARDVQQWAEDYPAAWTDPESPDVGKGLLLYGDSGTGKTTAASYALRTVIDHRHHGWFVASPTLEQYLHRHMDLSTLIRKLDHPDIEIVSEFERLSERLNKSRNRYFVVVIDDWGRERTTSQYLQDYIEGLLRERYSRGLPSIVTSNLTPTMIEERYGVQMVSFLHEAFITIDFGKRDHRRGAR